MQTSIDWMSLGINEIFTAADGAEGLHIALLHKPEIIISDVRMPRMTGIEMMEKIKQTLPDTVFLFMSGYSDKEYLKAAIRLQAISYVEKPLDVQEVEEAVREAMARRTDIERHHHADEVSNSISASQLALYLTLPPNTAQISVCELSRQYCARYGSDEIFHAAFTVLLQLDERSEVSPDFLEKSRETVHGFLRQYHMHVICAEKKPGLYVYHIFRKDLMTGQTVRQVVDFLCQSLQGVDNWYLAAGSIVTGIARLYESYSAAVIDLQHCFFYREKSCALLSTEILEPKGSTTDNIMKESGRQSFELNPKTVQSQTEGELYDAVQQVISAVKNDEREKLQDNCEKVYACVFHNTSLMQRSVQSLYYQMVSAILEQRRVRQLPGAGIPTYANEMLDAVNRCFSYPELHQLLLSVLHEYLEALDSYVPENSSVYLIKNYIRQHYDNPLLSTKEISEYASLSASYACTVFKNETGQTLNQYLTEFRMERAKELLSDPRHNVADVAGQVGYNDSNYFGKAFKKYSGMSPSEFRENPS